MQRELKPYQVQDLTDRIQALRDMWAGRFSDAALRHWVKTLTPFYGSTLFQVLERSMNEKSMPSLGHVLEALHQAAARERNGKCIELPPPLTPGEQKRSDNAAVLSMLWLHYERGWEARDFTWQIFKRLFERQGADAEMLLNAAKECYDRDTVRRWMAGALEKADREDAHG